MQNELAISLELGQSARFAHDTSRPSPCATGKYIRSIPARKTHFEPSERSRTQRSSNFPEVFHANVAGGPSCGSSSNSNPDWIKI